MLEYISKVVALACAALLLITGAAFAWGSDDGSGRDGSWYSGGGSYDGGSGSYYGPQKAISYINPDNGKPHENEDVADDSSCYKPDRFDEQSLSDPYGEDNSVHNDGCLFKKKYSSYKWPSYYAWFQDKYNRYNGPAAFETYGVGYIKSCPDPDGSGPKFSYTRDRNYDGKKDYCFQSGYQRRYTKGDYEYHVRYDNRYEPGEQHAKFCYDPNKNGCGDAYVWDETLIDWKEDQYGEEPPNEEEDPGSY